MKQNHAEELWTRFLDGELTARQRAGLKQSLNANPVRREAFVDDAEIDAVLRMLSRIDSTEDDFVSRLSQRITGASTAIAPAPEDLETDKATGAMPPLPDGPAVAPPPVPPPVAEDYVGGLSTHQVARHAARPRRADAAGPRASAVLLLSAAALVMIATACVVAIVATREDEPVAKDKVEKHQAGSRAGSIDDGPAESKTPTQEFVERPGVGTGHDATHQGIREDVVKDRTPGTVVTPDPTPDRVTPPIVRHPPRQDDSRTPGNQTDDVRIVARVTNSHGAIWKVAPGEELTAEPLFLENGLVEIEMKGGALVTVLGPSEFQLDSKDQVQLVHGRLNALVPPQAVGFSVATPSSNVVDLGTEFEVTVDLAGTTDVRVHNGRVELASLPVDDAPPQRWLLREGQFRSLQPDGHSYDFLLETDFDRNGHGTVDIRGVQIAVLDRNQLDAARKKVFEELAEFRRNVVNRRGSEYVGMVRLAGESHPFDNPTRFMTVWRRTRSHFDDVQKRLDRVGVFRGSININGNVINFDNLTNRRSKSELLKRMGIGVSASAAENLREFMRAQRDGVPEREPTKKD